MTTRMLIELPFSGFYYSKWSDMIDHCENMELESFEEREESEGVPAKSRLEPGKDDVWEAYYYNTDYSAAYYEIAQGFVDAFNTEFDNKTNFNLGLEFESMTSPREYNFQTDRIFAYIPRASVAWLAKQIRTTDNNVFADKIRERHSSRDGFISSYSNDLATWQAKPLSEYDHNELKTLLLAVMDIHKIDGDNLERDILSNWPDNGYHEWSNAVDWPKVESALAAMREEKHTAVGNVE